MTFLTGRCQRVRVGSAISSTEHLHAGVPQGAISSPLFFSLYTNDIVESADAQFNVCRRHVGVRYRKVSHYTTAEIARSNRQDGMLVSAVGYFHQPSKSAVMVLTRQRHMRHLVIQLNGQALPQVSTHKRLGIVLNRKLTWSDHVNFIRRKAAKKLGLLSHIRRRLPSLVIRTLYVTCVRPTLEYASGA